MSQKLKSILIRLPPEEYEAIQKAASQDNRSLNNWIRVVCKNALAELKSEEK